MSPRALPRPTVLLLVGLLALLVALVGTVTTSASATATSATSASATTPAAPARNGEPPAAPRGAPYSVLQMNLCLSGLAGCFGDTRYPAVVDEAAALVASREPDAVTLNEACSGDAADLARRTGYHLRFATVVYRGAPLPCRNPGGRGVFGNAVLVREAVRTSEDRAFAAQEGVEERRWLCVGTARGLTVCTTHLSTRGSAAARAANDAQCAEYAAVLAGRAADGPVVGTGDVNRQDGCGPEGTWTVTDAAAAQLPGIQHVYGTERDLLEPVGEVVPATYSDHDHLLVRARRLPPGLR